MTPDDKQLRARTFQPALNDLSQSATLNTRCFQQSLLPNVVFLIFSIHTTFQSEKSKNG
jgi:hypothetical protein